jgi:hypothetical protein
MMTLQTVGRRMFRERGRSGLAAGTGSSGGSHGGFSGPRASGFE